MNLAKIKVLAAIAIACGTSQLAAQDFSGKKITDVQVKFVGVKTVDAQRIKNFMSSATGTKYSADKLDNDIRALYKTGLIDNVSIKGSRHAGGVRLTAEVATRPILASVGFLGNRKFSKKTLARKTELQTGRILGVNDVTAARKKLQEHYSDYDYPDITITHNLQKSAKEGHANLIFTIDEGSRNTIRKIRFEGNRAFDHNLLYKEIKTRKKGIFSFITKSGKIDNNQLAEDIESVVDYYKDRGYLKASSPGPRIIPVKNGKVDIIIPIHEGQKYSINSVGFGPMKLFTSEQLLPTLLLDPGDPYSQSQLREDIKTIRAYYGSKGYADARVTPLITNAANGKINIKYSIEEGKPSKVGRINITGNSITKDKVPRREVTLKPGEPFNSVELETIKRRLKSLNYFDPIYVDTTPSRQPGYRDIDINVREQKTGSLTFGAGISSIENVVGYVGLEQRNFDITNFRNFRGGGQRLNVNIRAGGETTDARISLVEPWLFGKKLEAGIEVYYRDLLYLSDQYELTKGGIALHLRKAIGPKSSIKGLIRWESNDVDVLDSLAGTGSSFEQFEEKESRPSLTLSYIYNSRNSVTQPRRGHKIDIGLTYAIGDENVYTFHAKGAKHWNFKYDTILTLRGEFSSADVSGGGRLPIYDRQFLGGARNLRGFEFNDVGPRDAFTNEVFGGASKAYATAEVTIPIVDTIRGALFVDVGTVSTDSWDFFSDPYVSAGFGVRLKLPIGPLAMDYAFPIKTPDSQADKGPQFNFYLDYSF